MINGKECHDYDDIINLPNYFPPDRVRMPRASRAAQFAPFAALTGYDRAIETATDVFNTENYDGEL